MSSSASASSPVFVEPARERIASLVALLLGLACLIGAVAVAAVK